MSVYKKNNIILLSSLAAIIIILLITVVYFINKVNEKERENSRKWPIDGFWKGTSWK